MNSPSVSGSEWTLTEESFARFLAHLDLDRDRAGEKYEALRITLVKFFDWRGAHFPEDCADETFNRVARKIDSGEAIRDIMTYCHGVERFVDIPPGHIAYTFVEDMAARAITLGCGTNLYCPNDPVTRGQMAAFLVRAFGL